MILGTLLEQGALERQLIKEVWSPYDVYIVEKYGDKEIKLKSDLGTRMWYGGMLPTLVFHLLGEEEFLKLLNSNEDYAYYRPLFASGRPVPFPGRNASIIGTSEYGHPNVRYRNPDYPNRVFDFVASHWGENRSHDNLILNMADATTDNVMRQTARIAKDLLKKFGFSCGKDYKENKTKNIREKYKILLNEIRCLKGKFF